MKTQIQSQIRTWVLALVLEATLSGAFGKQDVGALYWKGERVELVEEHVEHEYER